MSQIVHYWDEIAKEYVEVSTATPLPTSSTGGGAGGSTKVTITGVGGDATTEGGALFVSEQGYSTITATVLNVPTPGTQIQLPNVPCHEVTIIAKRGNTGSIFVGSSNVSSAIYGSEMVARDSITLKVNNANLLWIDSTVANEGVSYIIL